MLTRTEAPDALIDVSELKEELGITHNESDAMLTRYLERATQYLDGTQGILGRAIGSQRWAKTFPGFSRQMDVELGPLISVDSIEYFDIDDVQQTLDLASFRVHGGKYGFYLKAKDGVTLPSTEKRDDAVTVNFTAGFGTADDIPEPIMGAIILMAGHYHHNPTAATTDRTHPIVLGVDDIIAPFRNRK